MKRTLSLLLALVLVLGSFSTVFAAMPETDVEKAELLKELGVLLGDGTDLNLEEDLKRRDAVVLLSRLMKAEELAKDYPTDNLPFDDITDAFYEGYLAWAFDNKYAKGISETKFDPNGDLTAQQFATFLLRALGYEIDAEAYETAFETAEELGIFADLNVEKETVVKRSVMAVMTFNVLYVPMKDSEVTLGEYLELELPQEEPEFAIKKVEATKVNEITVEFTAAVDTEEVEFKVTKDNLNVSVKDVEWEGSTVAVLETSANMTKGVHTVAATLGEVTVTDSFEVEDRKVAEINILNTVALTGDDRKEAYVYYEILDQYGQDARNIADIIWSVSAPHHEDEVSKGRIVLYKNSNGKGTETFTFNDQVVVVAVNQTNGVKTQETVTIGLPQEVDQVEPAGFVKKGSTEKIDSLPNGFKDKAYLMLFKLLDQNGHAIYGRSNEDMINAVNFVSLNPTVIEKIAVDNTVTELVIDGEEYYAAYVVPGMYVDDGGEVTIQAISTKTGNITPIYVGVGKVALLETFNLLYAKDMIADGESVEIAFEATSTEGEPINNFVTIARHVNLNALRLSASHGELVLEEQADGTAKLIYYDTEEIDWDDSEATDGQDRIVSLTSIVIGSGGNTKNITLRIKDKARPETIASVDMRDVLVEQGTAKISLSSFDFIDQYGRSMTKPIYRSGNDGNYENKNIGNIYDNGFFGKTLSSTNRNFDGYTFAVQVEYKGNAGLYKLVGAPGEEDTPVTDGVIAKLAGTTPVVLKAEPAPEEKVTTVRTGNSLRFEIVKYKDEPSEAKSVSPVRNVPLTIININQVKSLAVEGPDKLFVPTVNSPNPTGSYGDVREKLETAIPTPVVVDDGFVGYKDYENHKVEFEVTGQYNGKKVVIPAGYVKQSTAGAYKLVLDKDLKVERVSDNLDWKDLYNVKTARFERKDATDKVEIHVFKEFGSTDNKLTTVSKSVLLSDELPYLDKIVGSDKWEGARPSVTRFGEIVDPEDNSVSYVINNRFKVGGTGRYKYLDQYGVEIDALAIKYRIDKIEENNRYAENNFSFANNDSHTLTIEGAELGDKFVITIVASYGGSTRTLDVEVTVGADTASYITSGSAGNNYVNVLVKELEKQRLEGLGFTVEEE